MNPIGAYFHAYFIITSNLNSTWKLETEFMVSLHRKRVSRDVEYFLESAVESTSDLVHLKSFPLKIDGIKSK